MRPLRTLCNFFVWMLGLLADFAIGRTHSGDKGVDFLGIFNAFGRLHARADIYRERFTARAQQAHTIAHVCRCKSTTQDDMSGYVCWKL